MMIEDTSTTETKIYDIQICRYVIPKQGSEISPSDLNSKTLDLNPGDVNDYSKETMNE